jgi:hypothetical protein
MITRRWTDLSTFQRVALMVGATLQVGLLVAALWDLAHRTTEEVRGDRRMWAGLVFINWIGPAAYVAIGRKGWLAGAMKRCCASMPCCASMTCCGDKPTEEGSTETDGAASSA